MTNTVLFEIKDNIAIITLNRPHQRNAVNGAVCDGLLSAIDRLENSADLRAGILRGAGKVFCAGMDLKAFLAGGSEAVFHPDYGFASFVKRQRTKPIIAQVQGAALAGGFEIMLACDLIVAAEDAVFGLPEPKIGLVAGAGGAVRLGAVLPPVIANEILLTGDTFTASQARDWGLVNRVVNAEMLDQTALQLGQKIGANAPRSNALSLGLAAIGGHATAEMWAANDAAIEEIGPTDDAKEGVSAFLEKRAPVWKNR